VKTVLVSGSFDDLKCRHVRFLEEARKLGEVHIGLWTDDLVRARGGRPPRFSFDERLYLLQALRYVTRIFPVNEFPPAGPQGPGREPRPDIWAMEEAQDPLEVKAYCDARGLDCWVPRSVDLQGVPPLSPLSIDESSGRPRVVVTGCYDWFHSGHVRFFEEAAAFGDLYVGVGSDINLRRLKGDGHPFFPEAERVYMVQSVWHVKRVFVASGQGWLDAEPEIATIKPHYYIVNEDGDRPEKREFCRRAGIEYIVLSRTPKPGLPGRDSTALRGF
jgi:cytidyltransferase-like protein